jgi:hypothetical protein
LPPEKTAERFDTDGRDFAGALRLVIAGGPDKPHTDAPEREAEE